MKNVDSKVQSSKAGEAIGNPWRPRGKPKDVITWRDGEEEMKMNLGKRCCSYPRRFFGNRKCYTS